MHRKEYALQVKLKGVWQRFYAGNFTFTQDEAAWANQACRADFRFVLAVD